ncbi:MAG: Vitamin B12 import ATP-binding protein BtuD [Anaerolineales bacterium]|nr:Vitamin B12 import ATP-binding protein BtuD [Anaerolineales bacterium]
MSNVVISVENLSKSYRLGQIGTGTFANDMKLWWAKARGKPNPLLRIGETDHGNHDGEDLWALKDVSFTVEQGEVMGIIGRNGAGKSTLLKILSRVTAPTSGKVKIKGRIASLLEVGTGFHPELTGRENVYLNGAILGMNRREIDRKFDEIVDFAGVEKFIDTPVKRFSSGMYVRLAFAVAAYLEPEILVVDEVLAVGDAEFQKKCLGKMGDVAKEGRTVLFVSHNMAAIASLTQQSLCMDGGRIVLMGSTSDAIEKYLKQTLGHANGSQSGYMNLSLLKRSPNIINPDAQFEWVCLLDGKENQSGIFFEGEPIVIQLGFRISRETHNLQFGFGVRNLELGVELFVTPSRTYYQAYAPGRYSVRMNLSPNYLRPGKYSVILKMFANGRRQETFGESVTFLVEKSRREDGEMGHERWRSGLLRFDFAWSDINNRRSQDA